MTTRLFSLIAAALMATAPLGAHAADENGSFAVKGAGRLSCEQYLKIREEKNRDYYVTGGWIEGYISGVNAFQEKTYDATPWQTTELVLGLLARACEQNKEQRLTNLINQYLREVVNVRARTKSKLVSVKSDGKGLLIYTEVLSMVQKRLEALGYEPGVNDGTPDARTLTALRKYQAKKGLEETSLPDQLTLLNLFFAKEP